MDVRLLQKIEHGELPHALLITGPSGSGKAALARRAAAVYCLATDDVSKLAGCPSYTEMAGERIGIKDVRALMAAAAVRGFNDARRAFVLTDAHLLDTRTQNALLKVLEEPPADTMLLLTGNEAGFLPTIRSRCMIERLGALPASQVEAALADEGVEAARARICAAASDGITGLARYYASDAGWAFRTEAIRLLPSALLGITPFAETGALLLEDTAKDGKRRKADTEKARMLFTVWEGLLRDALCARYGGAVLHPDAAHTSKRIAESFTDGEIEGIIGMLVTARQRLSYRASASLTVDTLLAQMCLKEKV